MGQSSSFRIAGIAIVVCLIVAGIISIFSAPQQETGSNQAGAAVTDTANGSDLTQEKAGTTLANRMRILWYDTASRTYTFRDYPLTGGQDPGSWTSEQLPPPENGTVQRKAALVRLIRWDGTVERMIETRYLVNQETVTGILNSFTLIAPPPPVEPTPSSTPPAQEPTPLTTPAPGMLIPTRGQPCNQGDETITVSFGYINRHNTQVSLPIGDKNRFLPNDPDRGQPTVFQPGINQDVFSVSFPANGTNIIWSLMDTPVSAGYVPALKAGLIAEPLVGYAPLTVSFVDQSSGGTDENPLIGLWDLGDGTRTEEKTLTHRYEQPGRYQISRTVHTKCGIERAGGNITVYKADFTMEPVPEIPMTYRFFDKSEGSPAAWIWDFADDTTSLDQNPIHTWKTPGTYPVGLRIASKSGSGTVVRKVVVKP